METTKINPYNFNNQLINLDIIKDVLVKYDIFDEPTDLSLYQNA